MDKMRGIEAERVTHVLTSDNNSEEENRIVLNHPKTKEHVLVRDILVDRPLHPSISFKLRTDP